MTKVFSVLIAFVICTGLSLPVHADGYYHRHGGNWVGPFVGGMVLGGVAGAIVTSPPPPPVYVTPAVPYVPPPQCWQEFAYYDSWNRAVYRTVCR